MKIQSLIFHTIICALFASCNSPTPSQEQNIETLVFRAGESGYSHYRIPALLQNDRFLFAFAEARKNSASDHGNINIVLKRSEDSGRQWSNLMQVLVNPDESIQNPTPIYIPDENKIILLYTKRTVGADTEQMIREGSSKGYMGVYLTTSTDEGVSWSDPLEITGDVKQNDWRWYALGPGGAIIMAHNESYPGRIIVPANHSLDKGSSNEYLGAHVIFSDDKGISWEIGGIDSHGQGLINPNETAVVELNDGSLYFNTRNHASEDSIAHRAYTKSSDGGESFIHPFIHEAQLITPIVHASMCRNANSIYFIGPNHWDERRDLSIWSSDANSISWEKFSSVHTGFSAYSSAVCLDEEYLGILFEIEDYKKIVFKTIDISLK